jgi:hypothetical protein
VTGDQHRRPPFTWEAQCRFVESLLGDSPPGTLALLLRGTSPPDTAKPAEQAVHQWLRHSCTQAEAKPLVEPGQAEHEEPWTHAALRLARWIQVAQADTLETTARWLANSEAGQHTATDQSSCIPSMQTESAGGMDSVGSVHSVDSVGSVHSVDSVDSVGSVDSADGVNSVDSVHSGDSVDSVHSVDSMHSVHGVDSAHSVDSVHSVHSVDSVDSVGSVHSVDSVHRHAGVQTRS